jgi:hypothetical protein
MKVPNLFVWNSTEILLEKDSPTMITYDKQFMTEQVFKSEYNGIKVEPGRYQAFYHILIQNHSLLKSTVRVSLSLNSSAISGSGVEKEVHCNATTAIDGQMIFIAPSLSVFSLVADAAHRMKLPLGSVVFPNCTLTLLKLE